MATFVATFSAVSVTAAQDLFEIVAPSNRRVHIREIKAGQYSDAGDAQAEMLSLLLMRGHTTTGSGGSAVTPAPYHSAQSERSGATVAKNNTTVATNGDVATLSAESFNVMGGYRHYPVPEERIVLEPGQRFVVRITAPADALTMNGTILWDEV